MPHKELGDAFGRYKSKLDEKGPLDQAVGAAQAALDSAVATARAKLVEANDVLAAEVDALRFELADGRKVKPAVIRSHPNNTILAIGDDKLWIKQGDIEHVFGPPDGPTNQRVCEDCGIVISWPSEQVAVQPESDRTPPVGKHEKPQPVERAPLPRVPDVLD